MTDDPTVAVVGAGAVGLSTALTLAQRGRSVVLYDREGPGAGATGRAAGLCYDAYVEHTDASLAARSLERFRELGVLTEQPYVWVAREGDDHVAEAVREHAGRMRDRGRDVSVLSARELADRFPALRTDHLSVGAIATNAGHVDADTFVAAMVERTDEAGVELRTATEVELTAAGDVRTPTGSHNHGAVVVAAGPHTASLVAAAGCDIALGVYRAQALRTDPVGADPPILYDASERFYLRPAGDGLLVGNGAHAYEGDPDDYDGVGDDDFVAASLDRVRTSLGCRPAADRSWAGLCTATPDRDPLLGECQPGLYVATGWHGHGFMRGPAIGERLAGQVCGEDGIDHFDPTRFDGTEKIDLPDGITTPR